MSGSITNIDLLDVIYKRLNIKGFVLRSQTLTSKHYFFSKFKEIIFPLISNGTIKPVIDSIYSWENISEAHLHMENNLNIGKIVVLTG